MSIEKEKIKLITEKCQLILTQLLRDEDNKYCVDCDAKSPRWASWNIGIFLCIRCAGIHRKLGVHISKVKSVNLDSWTPQQVACIEQMGNSRARAVYEANLEDSFRRPQSDSSLEQFIRAKYETKKYIAKEWVPPALPNPNWDAEIERQLKKKKEKKVASGKIEFPAPIKEYSSRPSPKSLPKPDVKNGISKTSSASAALPKPSSNDNSTKSSGMVDLLGLDSPQGTTVTNGSTDTDKDIFCDFLSASEPLSTSADAAAEETKVQNDEANFFSQKAPEAGPEKLSKDSILALYNKAPNQPQPNIPSQFASQPYGNNGMFIRPNASPGVVQHPGGGAAPVVGGQPHMMTHVGAGIQQPNYSSLGSNMGLHMAPHGMPAVPPAPIHFSPANPFAQMQSQMNNMNLGSMPVGGQLPAAAPNPLASVMGYNFLPGNTQTNSSVTANLWQ